MSNERAYIGDGVYVSFDGYHLWITTQREDGEHRIALEPETFHRLVQAREHFIRPRGPTPETSGTQWCAICQTQHAPEARECEA